MRIIKQTFLALTIGLSTVAAKGQSIKDYFIPATPNNKATFYYPTETGGRTDMMRIIYYIDKGSSYDITDAKMIIGNPASIITKTLEFTNNEVKMTKSISTSLIETNKKRTHNPPVILLKMPPKGQSVKWTYTQISGAVAKCTATWTTVKVDGETNKVIRVEEEVVDGFGITIEYYVQGIGLWKKDFKGSDGNIKSFMIFDSLEYDPSAK